MLSTTSFQGFSAHPDRGLRANPAALSTTGPTGAIAILDAERGQFYSLNEVGGRVWELLRDGATFGAIVDRLCGEYDAAPETIGADVERLLVQLASVGLVLTEGDDDDER
ncbi:MAG TPA: PqqD family protein [Gemmatimonadaceae bacterium]